MIIKENIDFKRGQGSIPALGVGMDSLLVRTKRAERLEGYIKYINEDSMEEVIENIEAYENAIDNLIERGLKPEEIGIVLTKGKIAIPAWRVIQGNQITNMAFSESDANDLVDALGKYDIDRTPEYTYVERENNTYLEISQLKDFWKRRGWSWKN